MSRAPSRNGASHPKPSAAATMITSGPSEIADGSEEVLRAEHPRQVVAREVDERELRCVDHRGRGDADRERRRDEQEVRVGRREHGERGRESEGTPRRDRAAAHIVSGDREAVADDRARCTGGEDRRRLRVRQIELRAKRLEAARDEEAGRLVGHSDREQRDEHRRRMSRRGRCPSEEGSASIVSEPRHAPSVSPRPDPTGELAAGARLSGRHARVGGGVRPGRDSARLIHCADGGGHGRRVVHGRRRLDEHRGGTGSARAPTRRAALTSTHCGPCSGRSTAPR